MVETRMIKLFHNCRGLEPSLANLSNGIFTETLKSLQQILISRSKEILCNIQCDVSWSGVYESALNKFWSVNYQSFLELSFNELENIKSL